MKKSTKIVKRLLALFLVVLMSIESFGALVSDNDGSAFITKGEFDSLKSSLQSQIDNYNTSIDSKIDGAIAGYLAGVNLAKEVTYKVEISDWEKVLATNYILPEVWQMPSINLTFNYEYNSTNDNGSWYEVWWATAGIVYNKPSALHQVRNLVSAGVESTTNDFPENVVWLGQSCNYSDTITGVKAGVCASIYGDTSSGGARYANRYLYGATTWSADMSVVYPLQLSSGYVPGHNVNDIWNAQLWWHQNEFSYTLKPTVESDWINRYLGTAVSLNYVDGKQYKNEHIINYDNYTYTNLSDPTWTNTLGPNPKFTEEDVITNANVAKTGRWGVMELQDSLRYGTPESYQASVRQYPIGTTMNTQVSYRPKDANFTNFYSGGYNGTRNNNVMSVGVLDKTYTSDKIYQWSGERKLIRDDTKSVQNVNLLNGVLVAYAKMDETFKWEPKVTGTYYDTATNTDKPITKWRVKLSKAPFGTKDSVAAATDVLKNKNQIADYLVTDETKNTCKFEVEIGEDTVIFCKWWPDDVNICDNYAWSGTLDLKACGTYTIKES